MQTADRVHEFKNGVKVFDRHLVGPQRERYHVCNVHEQEEEDLFVEIISSLPRDGCFVNVGAGFGYYILLARKLAPHLAIHAFEPLADHARYIRENIALNAYSLSDFVLRAEAVSRKNSYTNILELGYGSQLEAASGTLARLKQLFALAGLKPSLKSAPAASSAAPACSRSRVRTISLATLAQEVGGRVDLLQMDVQGAEIDVLGGGKATLRSGAIKTFLIGTHGHVVHNACLGVLRQNGYAIEHEDAAPAHQPDGMIVASIGVRRLRHGAEPRAAG